VPVIPILLVLLFPAVLTLVLAPSGVPLLLFLVQAVSLVVNT
jgi:hypothetical protein